VDITVDQSDTSTAKISCKITASEFRSELTNGLRQAGGGMNMKGFRPGKIPLKVLEKKFGAEMHQEVLHTFLRKAYDQAVEDESLQPMASPRMVSDAPEADENGDYELSFSVPLKPSFELPDYKGLKIDSELEPVLPEQVQGVVEDIRRQESIPEPAGEEGIDENGVVLCDLNFLYEDEVVLEREGMRLSAHTPPPGLDPEAYTKALVGAKDDSVIELEIVLPADLENEAAQGQPGTCRLTIKQAFSMVPPPDEDIFAKLEVEDTAGLDAKIRERMVESAQERENSRQETALLDRVITETSMDLPETILEEQTEQRLEQMKRQLTEQGADEEQVAAQADEQQATARQEAERGLRALLVVESLGDKEELLVTAEDIQTELGAIAERNGVSVEEVRKYYSENNLAQQMTVEILERKVRKFLRESAEVSIPA
jgi:trigger factor